MTESDDDIVGRMNPQNWRPDHFGKAMAAAVTGSQKEIVPERSSGKRAADAKRKKDQA